MPKPNNPHDKLFKATFSDKAVVIDFIKNFLPAYISKEIDTDSLELQPISYVSPALEEFFSDMVYNCIFKKSQIEISLLFEHKSYVPDFPHLQILRYMVEAWYQMEKKKGLTPIIPIILYHGEETWRIRPFHSYFTTDDPDLVSFIPTVSYLLTNVSGIPDKELDQMSIGILYQALLLLKHVRDISYIIQHFQKLFSSLERFSEAKAHEKLIESFPVYILSASGIKEEIFIKLIQQLPPNYT